MSKEGKQTGDDQDEWKEYVETVRDLTAMPFITGIVQGFVSVGMKKVRERREKSRAEASKKVTTDGVKPDS